MNVSFCESGECWDAFVATMPEASNYHLWSWRQIVQETFGHRSFYLTAGNGSIDGILPLFFIESRLFGKFLVSVPFSSYGGILAASEEARTSLLRASIDLAKDLGARHIELRQDTARNDGWQSVTAKVLMSVSLPAAPEKYFASLPARLRNKIRSARKKGLVAKWGQEDLLDEFYRVFACNMRNLGTPVYPQAWFENLLREGKDTSRLLLIRDGEEPVAGTFISTYGNQVELPWIASTPAARRKYSTVLLYWTALEWAIKNHYRRADLGRCTPGSGTYRFKTQWNCDEIPLTWGYWLAEGRSVPHLRPDNPRFDLAIAAWKRLPLWLACLLGPRIVRSIP